MKTPFTGGCLCGAIRYECTATKNEIQMIKCHCRDCQHISGGPYTPVVFVPAKTFRITQGTLRYYNTSSDFTGPHTHKRGFCPTCGSRITGGENPKSTGIGVTAGSLDDPGIFSPKAELFVIDAQPWDTLEPHLPKFEKFPPK